MRRTSVKSKRAAPSDLWPSIHKNLGHGTSLKVCGVDMIYHGLRLRHAVPAMVAPSLCGDGSDLTLDPEYRMGGSADQLTARPASSGRWGASGAAQLGPRQVAKW